jgi:hypothetical protein
MRNDALLRHQKLCSLAGSSFAPMMEHRQHLGGGGQDGDGVNGSVMDEKGEEENDDGKVGQ